MESIELGATYKLGFSAPPASCQCLELYIYTLWSDVDYPKLLLEKLGFPITVVGEASDNPLVGRRSLYDFLADSASIHKK